METSVIGFPRIGKNRELKFAEEKFFRGEISKEQLEKEAANLRKEHWKLQKDAGISFIPTNDFSFYDNMLDTAVLFNIIPDRYKNLGLGELETYFAMARGYQGDKGDVKALAMKKWFNTNYHYMVPEIDDTTQIKLVNADYCKPVREYLEAKKDGIDAKVCVIGAFTLLKLARYTGSKTYKDYVNAVVNEYVVLISELASRGVSWIQFDEPYLVHDLSIEDISVFKEIYSVILADKSGVKVLLNTYFGDVRDIYSEIINLDFEGIGLDFIEGRKTYELIEKYGFPTDKLLFAGLVNGKNIWRNHYEDTLCRLHKLQNKGINVVLSTSCSLLHVPYTVESENRLTDNIKASFAFAKEKLAELKELSELAKLPEDVCINDDRYIANKKLREGRTVNDESVRKRVAAIKDSDFTRFPAFDERRKLQRRKLNLPFLPTTTIGSFPQTADVKKNRKDYKDGVISEEEYIEFNKKKIAEWVKIQEEIGLDVLVHGEFERNDMVEYFGTHLKGYVFTDKAWVQSYGTRCVKPPVIWGDVSRQEPITVFWSEYAKSLTDKPMKGMLTGPVTILNWSFPREDISIKESTYQIALAIRDEVLDLEKAGIDIIQIDEAALREKLPLRKSDWNSEYLDWAIPAFRLVHSGVKADTQIHTHMCYSEFTDIIPAIDAMDADVITFEASRSDLLILDALAKNNFKTEVGPGVYDIHSPRVPSVEEIKAALKKMLVKVEPDKLWVNPDCGLKTRGVEETKASLVNLVEAARELRSEAGR